MGILRRILRWTRNLVRYMRRGGVVYVTVADVDYPGLLKGKKAVVTGATSGIGLATARKFYELGADVLLVGRDKRKLIHVEKTFVKSGGVLQPYVWDLSRIEETEVHLDDIFQTFGMPDIWVNNAGIFLQKERFTSEEWDAITTVDCKSLYFILDGLTTRMAAAGHRAKIINITSNRGIFADRGPYGIAKIGAISLTEGFAKKYARLGIIINSIAPGVTATNINHIDIQGNLYANEGTNDRVCLPLEIAEIAAFLASDAANHIVGQTIVCDGGQTILSV